MFVCRRASNLPVDLPDGAARELVDIAKVECDVPLKRYRMTLGDRSCHIGTEVVKVVTEGGASGEDNQEDGDKLASR